jgi:hypothetical protein
MRNDAWLLFYRRRTAGSSVPRLTLSALSVDEDASVNDVIATIAVSFGSGPYTFTITADPDSKFQIANDDELQVADTLDYETATSHSVTIEADNGVDPVISKTFTITVNNVIETPVNTVAPAVTGVAQVGEVIQCSTGTWTDMQSGSFTYQWKDAADDSEIVGQTASTFSVTGEWVGESVYCTVTATNSAGSAAEDSNTVGPFDPAPGTGADDGFLIFSEGGATGLHLGML